jgi:hypothetical protein
MATAEQPKRIVRRVDPAEDAMRRWLANPGWCINERCTSKRNKRKAYSRGNCHCCYQALWLRIDSGTDPELHAWEDAEKRGYCLPKQIVRMKRFPVGKT